MLRKEAPYWNERRESREKRAMWRPKQRNVSRMKDRARNSTKEDDLVIDN